MFPFSLLLRRAIRHGELTVIFANGQPERFGVPGSQPQVTIRLHDSNLPRKLSLNPGLEFGRAYTDGTLTVEAGTLQQLLEILLHASNILDQGLSGAASRKASEIAHLWEVVNPIGRARRNVEHHYDLSSELYKLFLDKDWQYSCAYFEHAQSDLEEAQLAKKRHIAAKLLIKPGQHILDIGSGWGGLAIFIAQHYPVKVTGLTLSTEQYRRSIERVKTLGLYDRVKFKLQDYRQEEEVYDRIVSVGMFEHVGRPHFRQYFRKIRRLLKNDGVALIHTIGRRSQPTPINSWIRRYIFPGAYLPSLSQLVPIFEANELWLNDFENLRLHYARTLAAWNDRFQANRQVAAELYDERFCRMWEFYLQSCEAGFRYGGLTVFQMLISKQIEAVPLTRDYMFEEERRLKAREAGVYTPRLAGE